MAIQMRQGAYDDFDPSKMRAGEWAVSTDSDTLKQQIWMCFAPGVVKRIGTIEDFDVEIKILFQSYLDDISNSVNTARGYADTATTQAGNASNSATKAKTSETNAKTSETNAKASETKASTSASNASASATNASTSEANAKTSETNASAYATNAKASEDSATASKTASATSEANAKKYADQAKASATSASTSATNASASASNAKTSETNAKTSEGNSAVSEQEAQKYAEQVKEISESFSGALRPLGTINFADLPSTADATSGDMYNILDQFTTTADFKEGEGAVIPAGSNVYLTIDRMWDVLAGTPVTGVKGNAEKTYRRGNVNITSANIGALATNGDASNTTVKFTTATSRANIATGEKMSVLFEKVSKWFNDMKDHAFKDTVNNLTTTTTGSALDASQGKILDDKISDANATIGTTDISTIGDGTLKGAVNTLNNNLANINQSLSSCTKTKSDGTRYLMSDAGIRVTDTTNKTWLPVRALEFITDKGSLNSLIDASYASLYSVTGISTVNYGKNCNRGIIICNNVLSTKISANKWTTVATLPSGYRPCVTTPFECHYGTNMVIGQIQTSGIIQVYSSVELPANSQALAINAEYII